jgi:hypothetical protein
MRTRKKLTFDDAEAIEGIAARKGGICRDSASSGRNSASALLR